MARTKNRTFNRLVESIEAQVVGGTYAPGSKIPPVRELSKTYGVSIGTATRGINFLVDNHILETRRGAGTFVRSRESAPAVMPAGGREWKLAVFVVNADQAEFYCAHALRGVQDASQHHPCLLQTRFRKHAELDAALLEEAAAESDILLFLSDYDRLLDRLPRTRPSVAVEMHNSFGQINSTVTLDPYDAAELAADYFHRHGVRHVRIFSHDGPVHRTRSEVFAQHWRRFGTSESVETDPWDVFRLDCFDPEPGYFFTSGSTANGHAQRHREKFGGCFCAERKVVSLDGKERIIPNYEPMNSIGIDWYEAGQVAFEECLRRLRNPGSLARRIYLAGRFQPYEEMLPEAKAVGFQT